MDLKNLAANDRPRMSTSSALQRLALGRDGDAWTAILECHGMDILQLAERITGDRALSEDICQETLLQIRGYAGHFRPPAHHSDRASETEAAAKGWIMCIAYRSALGMLRQRRRRSQNEVQARVELRAMLPETRDSALHSEQLAALRQEVSELPESLQSAVCLHYYAHLSIPELSAALNCSQAAARKRVERGVQCLRERLAQGGLVLSALAVTSSLGAPARAAVTGGTASPSTAATVQCLEKWQSLLHSSATPILSGVAKMGVLVIMTKNIVGAVALLALLLCGVQTYRLNAVSRKSEETRALAAHALALRDKIDTLEKSLAARTQDVDRLIRAMQEHTATARLPVVAFEGFVDKPAAETPAGIAVAQKFNPAGLWRKQDGAYLRLYANRTLDFIDSKGTWAITGDKLVLDFEKWGHKEITLFDNDTIDDGEDVFTRVTNNMPVADKNLRPNFANPDTTVPGQKDAAMKYLGGGIIQYRGPGGETMIVDATQMLQQRNDEMVKGQRTQAVPAPIVKGSSKLPEQPTAVKPPKPPKDGTPDF